MMRWQLCLLVAALGSNFAWSQRAVLINDLEAAAVAKHPLSPYLGANTIAVVDVDLARVDVASTLRWAVGETATDQARGKTAIAAVSSVLNTLRDAGVSHLYAVVQARSLADLGPIVVIPCEDVASVADFVKAATRGLPETLDYTVQMDGRVVVVGPQATFQYLQSVEPTPRGDLVSPLLAERRLPHVAVVSLPPETEAILNQFWPDALPKAAPINLSPRQLISDLKRIVLGWSLPPAPKVRLTIEGSDMQGVARLQQTFDELAQRFPSSTSIVQVDRQENALILEADPEVLAVLIRRQRERAKRLQRRNDLRQIGIAINHYQNAKGHLPPRVFVDPQGMPLLSWRVALLPFVEQQALYDTLALGEPWDSESNRIITETVVPPFSAAASDGEAAFSRIRLPVFPGSAWHGDGGPPKTMKDITDGPSRTIAAIMAPRDAAVPWTSPEPWKVSEDNPLSDIFGDRDEVDVVLLDGSVRTLRRTDTDNQRIKALLTVAGGEQVD